MPPKRFFKKKSYDSSASAGAGGKNNNNNNNNKNNDTSEQPQIQFDLGVEKKKVTVRKFKNMKLVDIREYYQKDGNWLPGSKGMSLTEDQWNVLVSKMVDISEALIKIDDKEQLNVMKAALERKEAKMKEDEEDEEANEAEDAEEYETLETAEEPSSKKAITAGDDDYEEEEDEDIGDLEFEDVSEAPAAKRVKTE